MIIVGVLADSLGHTAQWVTVDYHGPGRNFDVEKRYAATPALEYRSVLAPQISVDVDHDRIVGEVKFLERTSRALSAVCQIDATSVGEGPWYFSPEVNIRRHEGGQDVELRRLAITRKPASIGLGAVEAFPGTLAEAASKIVYQHGYNGQLVKRAHEYNRKRRRGEPLEIHEPNKRRAPVLETVTPRAPIEYRSAQTVDVQPASRMIEVLAVPYGEPASVQYRGRWITETISNLAFVNVDRQENRQRIKATREHDRRLLFGRVITLDPHRREGLHAGIRVSRTALGDETLELCRDELLSASIGFQIPDPRGERWEGRDHRRVLDARLHEVSLVSEPAYAGADVLAVRDAHRLAG
jgi:HK97 family phage prohead protease